jgi:hypothetical protein
LNRVGIPPSPDKGCPDQWSQGETILKNGVSLRNPFAILDLPGLQELKTPFDSLIDWFQTGVSGFLTGNQQQNRGH